MMVNIQPLRWPRRLFVFAPSLRPKIIDERARLLSCISVALCQGQRVSRPCIFCRVVIATRAACTEASRSFSRARGNREISKSGLCGVEDTLLAAPVDQKAKGEPSEPAFRDGSYPVTDKATGSDIFVEYSIESVRKALQMKAARTGVSQTDTLLDDLGFQESNNETTRRRRKQPSPNGLFEALPDTELARVNPDDLSIQQLLYVLGRASVLANSTRSSCGSDKQPGLCGFPLSADKWLALFRSLRRRIHELEPLEITRACQALAYAKNLMTRAPSLYPNVTNGTVAHRSDRSVAEAECCAAFEDMQRVVATHVHRLHGDCLTRIFYASIKGDFPENAGFIEFACAEESLELCIKQLWHKRIRAVIGRLEKLRPWHVFRVFQSSIHSTSIDQDFTVTLGRHLVKNLAYLPAESIGALVPSCVRLGIFNAPSQLAKLNIIAGKRFRGLSDTALLIHLGEPMLSYRLLTPVNLVALLKGLMRAAIPMEYPYREGASVNMLEIHKINKVLLPLKLIEMSIRHDNPEVYKALNPSIREWLEKIRATQVKLTCFAPPLEQQHVNGPLIRLVAAEYHLHPSLYGPFLLELSDPLSRTTVEWDMPWWLSPSWTQSTQQTYIQRKHRYLKAEGWQVIALPLQRYLELDSAETRERFLRNATREVIPEFLRRSSE
ncbi:hypothetical protein Efla_006937 [Eimeria flavescens]